MRKWLYTLRMKKKLLQRQMAEKMNMSFVNYCMIENGTRQKDMSISVACSLAKVLGVSLDEIAKKEKAWKKEMSKKAAPAVVKSY